MMRFELLISLFVNCDYTNYCVWFKDAASVLPGRILYVLLGHNPN